MKKKDLLEEGLFLYIDAPPIKNNIRELIKEKKLKYVETARKIGVSRQALDMYIKNEQQPTIEIALKLSLFLKEDVSTIFELDEGAWYHTAKDEDGFTLFYDNLKNCIRSGDHMKSVKKNIRFDAFTGQEVPSSTYMRELRKEKRKMAELNKSDYNRNEVAKIKKEVEEIFEKRYPMRYIILHEKINPIT